MASCTNSSAERPVSVTSLSSFACTSGVKCTSMGFGSFYQGTIPGEGEQAMPVERPDPEGDPRGYPRLQRRRPCRRSSKHAGTNTGMAAWKAALPDHPHVQILLLVAAFLDLEDARTHG